MIASVALITAPSQGLASHLTPGLEVRICQESACQKSKSSCQIYGNSKSSRTRYRYWLLSTGCLVLCYAKTPSWENSSSWTSLMGSHSRPDHSWPENWVYRTWRPKYRKMENPGQNSGWHHWPRLIDGPGQRPPALTLFIFLGYRKIAWGQGLYRSQFHWWNGDRGLILDLVKEIRGQRMVAWEMITGKPFTSLICSANVFWELVLRQSGKWNKLDPCLQ